jgi:hypothetical protein
LSEHLSVFYQSLSRINPSSYVYFLKFEDRQIVGSGIVNIVTRYQNVSRASTSEIERNPESQASDCRGRLEGRGTPPERGSRPVGI